MPEEAAILTKYLRDIMDEAPNIMNLNNFKNKLNQ